MGQLLIDVLTLEKEGLVGFTKDGEEVPLSAPKIGWIEACLLHKRSEESESDFFIRKMMTLAENSKNNEYFHFAPIKNATEGPGNLWLAENNYVTYALPYNAYTRRE